DRERSQIAVHVPELNDPSERGLVRPLPPGERRIDDRGRRRVRCVAVVEQTSADERYVERLEEARARDSKFRWTGAAPVLDELRQLVEGELLVHARHNDKHSVPITAARQLPQARSPDQTHAR